jgi:hypothetical protein
MNVERSFDVLTLESALSHGGKARWALMLCVQGAAAKS